VWPLPKLEQRLREPWNSFLHNAKALNVALGVEPAIHITMYGPAFQTIEERVPDTDNKATQGRLRLDNHQ
jgi:hypothetical protein